MMRSGTRKWGWGLLALAGAYLVAVYLIPGFVGRSDGRAQLQSGASAHCTKDLTVPVQHGEHKKQSWSVLGSIENNGDCHAWLLSMEFRPQDVTPGSWKGSWAVPAGGHLPDSATIGARDETTGEDRVVSGVVGWRVRSVVFRTRSGRKIVVHPRVPEPNLTHRFVWLQHLRYFIRFYPLADPVKVAKLLDARGGTIATVRARLGEFEGFMGAA